MLTLRPATENDATLLWEWVNDDAVRAASFRSEPISWRDHLAWFRARQADPRCHFWLVLGPDEMPIGQVRFDVDDTGAAEVDVSIARAERGRSHAAAALRLASEQLFATTAVKTIVAHVKPENAISLRAFERAGWQRAGSASVNGIEAIKLVRDRWSPPAGHRHA